jgi:hypothetical protein
VPQVRRRRRTRRRVAVGAMCQKHAPRCPALLQLRDDALQEWTGAETLHEVLACWGRLGGRVTLHRYGPQHFSELARRRRSIETPMQAR